MAIREGRWDCQYCGKTAILGREQVCPQCAKTRPPGTKFYLPPDETAVSDQKLVERAKQGSDWVCDFCRATNPASQTVCYSCGAQREATSSEQVAQTYDLASVPRTGDKTSPPETRPTAVTKPKSGNNALKWVGGLVVLCLLALVCRYALLGNSEVTAEVTGLTWQRSVVVEAYGTVTESDWSIPLGGRLISQNEEIHHYDQVLTGYVTKERQVSEQVQTGSETYVCGQRDAGNGFFEDVECSRAIYETQYHTESYQEPVYESVPRYSTKYTYEIEKWTADRTETASGTSHEVYWPRLTLANNEREGERTAVYTATFTDEDGKSYTWEDVPEEKWDTLDMNGRYPIIIDHNDQVIGLTEN